MSNTRYMGLIAPGGKEVFPYDCQQRPKVEITEPTKFNITVNMAVWGVIICKDPQNRSPQDELLCFRQVLTQMQSGDTLEVHYNTLLT